MFTFLLLIWGLSQLDLEWDEPGLYYHDGVHLYGIGDDNFN